MSNAGFSGDIKAQIVERRRRRISREGYALGHDVPEVRRHPVVPFLRNPGVICEIKRKSPSKGNISITMDPVKQAGHYSDAGVPTVSVLTEEDYFAGSLEDLMAVKDNYPGLCVLRKDFLIDTEDIELSYRAGADAVLLIASMLSTEELVTMYRYAATLGLSVLFEVHDKTDIAKAAAVKPEVIGINCRDLRTFSTDLVYPLKVKGELESAGVTSSHLVFESGIFHKEDAAFAFSSGFSAILVGESVVRNPALVPRLIEAASECTASKKRKGFWAGIYGRRGLGSSGYRPLVKICGITRREDALLAAESGADILGVIMAESPRRAAPGFFEIIRDIEIPKVAVVVSGEENWSKTQSDVRSLLEEGLIDAVQFHGDEDPSECFETAFPYYKALRIRDMESVERIPAYRSPRVLIDAFSKDARGGTGKRIDTALVEEASKRTPLWLAGGIGPGNIADIIRIHKPDLVDAASGLESSPGIKDREKVQGFFSALARETEIQ